MINYSWIRPFIFLFPPEIAHNIAINLLKLNLIPSSEKVISKQLEQNLWDLNFKSPVGLAAGFSKNAEGLNNLNKLGFGFVETGTVTPKAQSGNPKPRLFRLTEQEAIINRLGFNNLGKENYLRNYQKQHQDNVCGINIGKNKNSENFLDDYLDLLQYFYPYADYITVNISSPNTPNLRDIQNSENLSLLISELTNERKKLSEKYSFKKPIFLKIAPDLNDQQLQDICHIALKYQIDSLIISNTTITRNNISSAKYKNETGGLSGKPLFNLSTKILSEIYKETKGSIPLIGVGGIASAQDVYEKIISGASLVQLYSALIYQGFALIDKINQELPKILTQNGFNNISEAVGKKN